MDYFDRPERVLHPDAQALREIRYPDIHAGIDGVRWVENCVRSADNGGIWVKYT